MDIISKIYERMSEDNYNIANILIRESKLYELIASGIISGDDFSIKKIEPKEPGYPDDPKWIKLNSLAKKAYKDLKDYEYEKRN